MGMFFGALAPAPRGGSAQALSPLKGERGWPKMAIDREYFRSVLKFASALCAVEWQPVPEGGMFALLSNGCGMWAEPTSIEVRGPATVVALMRPFPGHDADLEAAVSAAVLDAVFHGGTPLEGGMRIALTEKGVECECLAI